MTEMAAAFEAGYDTLPDDELEATVHGLVATTRQACADVADALRVLAQDAALDADQVVATPPEAWTLHYSGRVEAVRRAIGVVMHERAKLTAAGAVRNRRDGTIPGRAAPGRSPG